MTASPQGKFHSANASFLSPSKNYATIHLPGIENNRILLAHGYLLLLNKQGRLRIYATTADTFVPAGELGIIDGRGWLFPGNEQVYVRGQKGQLLGLSLP